MNQVKVEEQFRLLQQEVELAGDAIDNLRREHRAEIVALHLEIAVLRRSLMVLHPEFAERYDVLREQVLRETDPEAS
jgi:hypothetical protein